jgi:hypothetical protein
MPTTVTGSNGEIFHVYQLPALSATEVEDSLEIATIDNDLGDGYRSGLLTGASAGVRSWKITLGTLASLEVLPNTMTGAKGEIISREQYLRSLFAENKVTGRPFVYDNTTLDGTEYVFVDFADRTLSMKRFAVKIYSTGVEIRERRLPGVTIV